jgi:hypothetical protein
MNGAGANHQMAGASMTTRIVFNGQEYASPEAMPEDVRKAYFDALAMLRDSDGSGIPDVFEGRGANSVIGIQQSSITFNGRTLSTEGRLPQWLHGLAEAVAAQAAASAAPQPESADQVAPQSLDAPGATMGVMLAFAAGFVFIFSVGLMFAIGGGREHLRGRLMVAVPALLLLGWLDTMATRVAKRRQSLLGPDTPGYRRYVVLSASGLLLAMVLLLGLAWYLP